jgi:internalin A
MLETLVNLEELALVTPKVTDLAPIAGLTSLVSLRIDTKATDLSPLAKLTALEEVSIDSDGVSDLAWAAGLVKLRDLSIAGTQIADLAPLAKLPLEALEARGCRHLASIAPLANVKTLVEIDLRFTRVTDLSPLAKLPALKRVAVGPGVSDDEIAKLKRAQSTATIEVEKEASLLEALTASGGDGCNDEEGEIGKQKPANDLGEQIEKVKDKK